MGKRGPCSFVLKSMAQGAERVEEKLTVEQKVDRTEKTLESVHSMLALSKLLGSKHIEKDKSLAAIDDTTQEREELAIAMPARSMSAFGSFGSFGRRSFAAEEMEPADSPSAAPAS